MTLAVNNPESGSATEELAVDYDSEPIEIGFNARYLLDITGRSRAQCAVPAGRLRLADGRARRRGRQRALCADAHAGLRADSATARRGSTAIAASSPADAAVVRCADPDRFPQPCAHGDRARARPVVLTGENGAGKTNLLEAVSFLAPGRASGASRCRNRAARGRRRLGGCGQGRAGAGDIGTGLPAGTSEESTGPPVRIDGTTLRVRRAGRLRVVWLTPAMDRLFTGPASDRRRFFDRLVLAFDPAHARGRRQLRKGHARAQPTARAEQRRAWLDGVESRWPKTAWRSPPRGATPSAVSPCSIETAARARVPFPGWPVGLDGLGSRRRCRRAGARRRGSISRSCAVGAASRPGRASARRPARSDIMVRTAPRRRPPACSTGEQKALLVGIVLAHAGWSRRSMAAAPIILLDEIAAHLDPARRQALFAKSRARRPGLDDRHRPPPVRALEGRPSFCWCDAGSDRRLFTDGDSPAIA